jgi:hypothetical protein
MNDAIKNVLLSLLLVVVIVLCVIRIIPLGLFYLVGIPIAAYFGFLAAEKFY